jgi:hypothetical protein
MMIMPEGKKSVFLIRFGMAVASETITLVLETTGQYGAARLRDVGR